MSRSRRKFVAQVLPIYRDRIADFQSANRSPNPIQRRSSAFMRHQLLHRR
jgi:hypothetical protein